MKTIENDLCECYGTCCKQSRLTEGDNWQKQEREKGSCAVALQDHLDSSTSTIYEVENGKTTFPITMFPMSRMCALFMSWSFVFHQ